MKKFFNIKEHKYDQDDEDMRLAGLVFVDLISLNGEKISGW